MVFKIFEVLMRFYGVPRPTESVMITEAEVHHAYCSYLSKGLLSLQQNVRSKKKIAQNTDINSKLGWHFLIRCIKQKKLANAYVEICDMRSGCLAAK